MKILWYGRWGALYDYAGNKIMESDCSGDIYRAALAHEGVVLAEDADFMYDRDLPDFPESL